MVVKLTNIHKYQNSATKKPLQKLQRPLCNSIFYFCYNFLTFPEPAMEESTEGFPL